MSYQPGNYDYSDKYFSKDTMDIRSSENLLSENENQDICSIDSSSHSGLSSPSPSSPNSPNLNNTSTTTNQTNKSKKKKMAKEAGFSVRNTLKRGKSTTPQDENDENDVRPTSVQWNNNNNYTHMNGNTDTLRKAPTLSRPERQLTRRRPIMRMENQLPPIARTGATSERPIEESKLKPITQEEKTSFWVIFSRICTFWALPSCMRMCGMKEKHVQQAWREKVTLCLIILCMMFIMGFFTFALQPIMCPESENQQYMSWKDDDGKLVTNDQGVLINGVWYSYKFVRQVVANQTNKELSASYKTMDISNLFRTCVGPNCNNACKDIIDSGTLNDCNLNPAKFSESPFKGNCIPISSLARARQYGKVVFDWDDVVDNSSGRTQLLVYNGSVLNVTNVVTNSTLSKMFRPDTLSILTQGVGRDITRNMILNPDAKVQMDCLLDRYFVGVIDRQSTGCYLANVFMIIFLISILGVVLVRFFMALAFDWFLADKLSVVKSVEANGVDIDPLEFQANIIGNGDMYTICLVTCYSEGKEGLRTTMNSLATTTYNDKKKLLFIIADGQVVGLGNSEPTPEIARKMIYEDPALGEAQPMSYLAIATGDRQHNMARVHAGTYQVKNHTVPIIIVGKCGTPAEANTAKPGNRGKRDSQIILMNFLSRVLYNDRMTPLDYDLFTKIRHITGVTPDKFEIVLMVDADTKVLPDSLSYMVNAMRNDNRIMGLCGETRIANKTTSWVTCIQVFEYYISHHLGKAFESVFGGVTCLPGCFCMYRIKAPKDNEHNKWVPILANVDIVEDYSENVVDTLHKKNLLLLGEDRFLSTLMLNNFPKRKMVFVPKAKCKTIVPDKFSVLLSQRRRWINSTIHNLMELVLVKDLCGTFCFSMQFVVALELFGTVVLPAAICFTIYLVSLIIFTGTAPVIPILMLVAILGLPGVLILLTSHKVVYVLWMLIYLLSLPIWNLVLPLYSFWHFDDFSWGETRKVDGGEGADAHDAKGEGHKNKFDVSTIPLKKWEEYEVEARQKRINEASKRNFLLKGNLNINPNVMASTMAVATGAMKLPSVSSGRRTPKDGESLSSSSKTRKKSATTPTTSIAGKSPSSSSLPSTTTNENGHRVKKNRSKGKTNNLSSNRSERSESSFTSASSPYSYYSNLPPNNINTNKKIIILPPQSQQQHLQMQQMQQEQQMLQLKQKQFEQIRQSLMNGGNNNNKRNH